MTQSAIPGLEPVLTPEQAEVHIRADEAGTRSRCRLCGMNADLCSGASLQELDRAQQFIECYAGTATSDGGRRRGWSFATSMPDSPHEYAVRERALRAGLEGEFQYMVVLIRSRGYKGRYGRVNYDYLNIETDGIVRRYWTGNPLLLDTKIINRTPVDLAEQAKLRAANVRTP